MGFPRLPRFSRTINIKQIQLTPCDLEIIRLVEWYRFLRSTEIISLFQGNTQRIQRRLQLLYHHGYLERPRSQLDYFHQGGSRPLVYGLGNKGASLLAQEDGASLRKVRWGPKNRSIGRIFLEHALLVSEVVARIETACQKENIRFMREEDLFPPSPTSKTRSIKWKVNIGNGIKLGVIPDRVFALEFPDENGNTTRAYFFLEADRGTMPVVRRGLLQTSFYRKLLAYEATWSQGIHRSRFGFHRFRVLTITTSPARVNSLVDACAKLKRGHGLFLFTDRTTFQNAPDVFSRPFQTGIFGKTGMLLD